MLSYTLNDYKENYDSKFLTYQKEYKDNTLKTFFFKELEDYKAYHQALVNLKELILPYYEDDFTPIEVDTHQVADLKKINENAYSEFITDEDNTRYLHLIDENWKDVGPEASSLVDSCKLENLIVSSIRIIDFITVELEKSKLKDNFGFKTSTDDSSLDEVTTVKYDNPYPQIFASGEAFLLFDKLFTLYKDTDNMLADFSFIYRMMYKDGYILPYFKSQMFVNWLDAEPYNIFLGKTKTLHKCTTKGKVLIYNNAKEIIKIN